MIRTEYQQDIIQWAYEQAHFIRSGQFDLLDREHLADEIEDVAKSEQRELASRMAVLLAHLLKWKYQPERRGNSRRLTIKLQRKALAKRLKNTPSLKPILAGSEWQEGMWNDGVVCAMKETGREDFPETCPWTFEQALNQDWLPD
ncbi:conserved hypothetical protein [Candidatus Glomeribacter gigasporarum BEG34]|uniref:DUF29 domain-containing protein n=1 Tax=Candidatus Glomeribacter gigasporarum BEG34 TaxID=1070319 RepID=G2J7Q5_9BURK|nr:DUF29 domain-containing protein [Candidatus Glomeribacter gigasporarum]CCD28800.1 conserved hypothetical protein [Candidatus Glomeribacter gigasporarum BEG34]